MGCPGSYLGLSPQLSFILIFGLDNALCGHHTQRNSLIRHGHWDKSYSPPSSYRYIPGPLHVPKHWIVPCPGHLGVLVTSPLLWLNAHIKTTSWRKSLLWLMVSEEADRESMAAEAGSWLVTLPSDAESRVNRKWYWAIKSHGLLLFPTP